MKVLTVALVLMLASFGIARQDPCHQDSKRKSVTHCPNVWYSSESCPCAEKPCKACGCGTCGGGAACCCIAELKKGTGVLTGTVAHKSATKFPTAVWIESMDGRTFLLPPWTPRFDQKNKEFLPKVLPVLVGTTVEFLNSDGFEHNVNSPDSERFNLGNWGQNEKRTYTFTRTGVYTLLCSLHPEMVGYAVVVSTPYFAVADEKGEFRIPNVPAGKWKVRIWNERLKPKQLETAFEVTVEEGKVARFELKP